MNPKIQDLFTFHLTGERSPRLEAFDPTQYRPVLLARYADLDKVRYDYPLVLVEGQARRSVRSLKSLVNELLQTIAPEGIDGERTRRQVLSAEVVTFSAPLSSIDFKPFIKMFQKTCLSRSLSAETVGSRGV